MFKKLILPVFLAACFSLSAAPAPDFTITDSDGNTRQLYADFVNQGKIVVLEIFFINCPPCVTHAPHWQTLYTNMKAQYPGQVEFLMLSNKNADNNAAVAQYKISKGLTMPAAGSNGGSLAAVQPYESGQFGPFYGTPTFVVIQPGTGEVVFDVRGSGPAATMDLLSQEIAQLLQALPKCHIKTYQNDTLQNYAMTVSLPGGVSANKQITDGDFSLEDFPGLPNIPFYQAVPAKNNDPLNGVSTLDLLQINKQILGIEPFLYPWQFVAGDANGSGTLTTFDIIELRKLILGVYDSLPNVNSWVFSPPMDTISPLECPVFYAIKKGDVNGNADPAGATGNAENRSGNHLPVLLENPWMEAGAINRIHLRAGASGAYQGLQLAMRFDPDAFQVLRVESDRLPGFGPEAWHEAGGRLALSWFGEAAALPIFDPVITLEVRALRSGRVGEMLVLEQALLRAEAYRADGQIEPLEWQVEQGDEAGTGIWPNPAKGSFFVKMPPGVVDSRVVIQMVDGFGRVAYEQVAAVRAGTERVEMRPAVGGAGVYWVVVDGVLAGKVVWTGE